MGARYRLILQRPLNGLAPSLALPELYREQRRIDPLLSWRELPPIRHFVCALDCDEPTGERLDCWHDAETGRRLVHAILGLIHSDALAFGNRQALLLELYDFSERMERARFGDNRWHLGLELAFD
ncbi:hypothetical protein [Pseudomonas sp. GCEP-101]|uniref:hypothetical protein n=1 Tax=Pseudomonas sp. GCEP-101 TaxID=2974552 RepID=UPI00223B4AA6|nr:hypothetical protein [Pseudomonas sp. GCEP-101]